MGSPTHKAYSSLHRQAHWVSVGEQLYNSHPVEKVVRTDQSPKRMKDKLYEEIVLEPIDSSLNRLLAEVGNS